MNTTENNKLIAEFLISKEANIFEFPQFGYMTAQGVFKTCFPFNELKFHKDWNWLIEAIEKCREKHFFGSQQIISTIDNRLLQLDLLATHSNVVEFIKMYNLQNK